MKIIYIIPRFYPFKGGAEQNFEALALSLASLNHEVKVFTSNIKFKNTQKLKQKEKYKNITIIRFWAVNKALYAGFYPFLLPKLIFTKADLIHVSGFGFFWIEICLIIKKIVSPKTKFINTPHGPFLATSNTKLKKIIKKLYTPILSIIISLIYNKIISVVPKQKEWMQKEYKINSKKIELIPNGIYKNYIEKSLPKFKKDEKIIITYLNRMEWYKGIQDVLFAIDLLDKKIQEKIEFWIMGREGAYTKKLRQIIKEKHLKNIQFIFTPSDKERDNALLKSQINILPSKWEATGIVLIESMAKGNVIITTNQNEAKDLLINPKSGYSYNFGDFYRLKNIIENIVLNYEKRIKMIQYNHNFVKNFTWEAMLPKYFNLIQSLSNEDKTS